MERPTPEDLKVNYEPIERMKLSDRIKTEVDTLFVVLQCIREGTYLDIAPNSILSNTIACQLSGCINVLNQLCYGLEKSGK